MQFEQRDVGPYRLYAGAREVASDSFEAMIVVEHTARAGGHREVFRSQRVAGSRLFSTAAAALNAALREGGIAVRDRMA